MHDYVAPSCLQTMADWATTLGAELDGMGVNVSLLLVFFSTSLNSFLHMDHLQQMGAYFLLFLHPPSV